MPKRCPPQHIGYLYNNHGCVCLPACSWTPPNYVFPLVWIPLKVMQSAALWLVLNKAKTAKELALPLAAFGTHLFLGNWWNGKLTCSGR